MGNNARTYTLPTIKKLYGLSGNRCTAPDCGRVLIVRDGISITSKICHIEGASSDGPRYNPSMSDKDRAHYDNLILLCDECHTMIDNKANEGTYPVALLKEWKKNHESTYLHEQLRNSSLLTQAINAIAAIEIDDIATNDRLQSFDISDKINFNNIRRNRPLIEEYSGYYAKINSLYGELEEQGQGFKKERLLRNIHTIYLTIKGKYLQESPDSAWVIQENADSIFEDIESELFSLLDNQFDHMFSISIVMVDAFMRCKIFEEPYA